MYRVAKKVKVICTISFVHGNFVIFSLITSQIYAFTFEKAIIFWIIFKKMEARGVL